jgi:hypothetical protein
MGFKMFSCVKAYPVQELPYLVFPTTLKSLLGRATLLVPPMDKTCSNLAGDELFSLANANSICPKMHQY